MSQVAGSIPDGIIHKTCNNDTTGIPCLVLGNQKTVLGS